MKRWKRQMKMLHCVCPWKLLGEICSGIDSGWLWFFSSLHFISYLFVRLSLPTYPPLSLSLSLHFFISLFLFISLYLFIPFPNHVLSQQYFHLQRPHDWINSISDSFVSDRDRDSNFRASWMYCLDPKWTAVVSFSYFMTGGLGSFIFKNI